MDLMRLDRATVPSLMGHRDDFRGVCLCLYPDGNVSPRAKAPVERLGQFGIADRRSQITVHSNHCHSHTRFLLCERALEIDRGKKISNSIALVASKNALTLQRPDNS